MSEHSKTTFSTLAACAFSRAISIIFEEKSTARIRFT